MLPLVIAENIGAFGTPWPRCHLVHAIYLVHIAIFTNCDVQGVRGRRALTHPFL